MHRLYHKIAVTVREPNLSNVIEHSNYFVVVFQNLLVDKMSDAMSIVFRYNRVFEHRNFNVVSG